MTILGAYFSLVGLDLAVLDERFGVDMLAEQLQRYIAARGVGHVTLPSSILRDS